MTEHGIGAAVRRKEDVRFLTGRGRYTDDLNRPGQLHAYILRSPHAHAEIAGIDIGRAKAAPGVVAVFTGADMQGSLPCGWLVKSKDGSPMAEPPHPVLAQARVRHVGEPVVAIIAGTCEQAKDAAELVEVDYKPLPAVVAADDAIKPGKPQLFDIAPNNLCFDWHLGDKAAVDAAFRGAHHVTRLDLVNNRLVSHAMEPRAAVAEFDRGTGQYTLHTNCRAPHVVRLLIAAFVLQMPEHKFRVVAPDVGGGFGTKGSLYQEQALVTWAAGKLGRPVKWTGERAEGFVSDNQARDHVTRAELALDEHGKFLALRVQTLANLGGYLGSFAPLIPTYCYGTLLAGTYTTPAIYVEVKGVFTNTVPVDAYRGAGRPEACYVVERIVDAAAREMRIDPAELRRRNFIPKHAFPYQTPVLLSYDSGDYFTTLDMALEAADYAGFERRRQEAAKRGKLRGIGIAAYIEACAMAPSALAGQLGARAGFYETAEVRAHPTGSVTVFMGTHNHGQGHETTFAQIVAEQLGVPIDMVDVVHGDTDKIPFGMGTYASRSLAVGGSALVKAVDKVINKGKKIAAHLLEAAEQDIEFKDGKFAVVGTDRAVPFAQIAFSAYVPHNYPIETLEPGLDETAFYDPSNFTYPAGAHVAEVEVDRDTGAVALVNFTAADDFGRIINPMIVAGQVHGGLAQGIGQALLENTVYDPDSGQLRTGSLMDYCLPRADNLASFSLATHETLCTHNPLGAKGCGEAGAIGAPPAIMNAVIDALAPLGVSDVGMPATAERVWRAIAEHARA
ncbi:MAG TPA: xanthine dehydrogenase family protein molybdopterin-binding subunit [Stellaceae bacterium]|nr:xanthine dehydrogenase family protein molybdopterin-binding subunit [Stellaceae bacterium]